MMSGEKVICRRVSDGVLINIPHTFDLKQIADSGQCFRLTALQDGGYVAITGMKLVKITPDTNGGYVFHCPYYDQFASQTAPASDSDLEQFRKLFQEMRAELQDNDCGQWSAEARQWALDMGLITGNGTVINGEPNYMWQDLVTREQFVTVLYRLAQIMGSPA